MRLADLHFSLPAAVASYGLSLGVARIGDTLPPLVYALISGLNAATVGIIALAAVQLSQKAITDKLTRVLVFLGATAGMLYNALWYFPVLMCAGGSATIFWDYRLGHKLLRKLKKANRTEPRDTEAHGRATEMDQVTASDAPNFRDAAASRHTVRIPSSMTQGAETSPHASDGRNLSASTEEMERTVPRNLDMRVFSWRFGTTVIACFFVTFLIVMVLRGVLQSRPRGFNLFANLYLAGTWLLLLFIYAESHETLGTIIFGGGPVVIPLLSE